VVVLTLTLVSDAESVKESVVSTLRELQSAARNHPACIRYDICHAPADGANQILINQSGRQEGQRIVDNGSEANI